MKNSNTANYYWNYNTQSEVFKISIVTSYVASVTLLLDYVCQSVIFPVLIIFCWAV
jgi:hypothetical protein